MGWYNNSYKATSIAPRKVWPPSTHRSLVHEFCGAKTLVMHHWCNGSTAASNPVRRGFESFMMRLGCHDPMSIAVGYR